MQAVISDHSKQGRLCREGIDARNIVHGWVSLMIDTLYSAKTFDWLLRDWTAGVQTAGKPARSPATVVQFSGSLSLLAYRYVRAIFL